MAKATTEIAPSWLKVPADLNALSPKVWPATAMRNTDGEFTIGGVTVDELANQFGTPLYVIDEHDFRARAASVQKALVSAAERIGTTAKVYYASKAFLCTQLVEWVDELGLCIDVASSGELAAALAGGIPASRIGLHGNNKSPGEIGRAIAAGVGAIVIDSDIEIERIASIAAAMEKVQPVRLRVSTGVHADTHDFLATAREDQKFGIPLAEVPALVAKIRSDRHLKFLGLHQHIGSQIYSADGFVASTKVLVQLHAELLAGGDIPELNLGGGFGINYKLADDAPDVAKTANAITDAVAAECQRLGIKVPALAFEPGRAIIGNSGITLYNVGTIKDVALTDENGAPTVRKYVSVDGGMSDNIRTALYEAEYHTVLASRVSSAPAALSRVVGKHCESGDIVVRHDYLPDDVAPNDLLAVAATGAYCHSMSNNYNWLTRPPVVAVRGGNANLLVRGETEADLFARDMLYQRKHGGQNSSGGSPAKNEKD
jgi:diaminopimelate decarboxylase